MISLFLSLPFIHLAIADAPSANYVTLYGQFINYTSYKHFPAAKFVEKFSNKSNWETLACNTIYCHFEDKNDCVSLCSKLMKTRTNDDPLNPRYDFEDEPECKTACGEDCWNDHVILSVLPFVPFISYPPIDWIMRRNLIVSHLISNVLKKKQRRSIQ
ncbi:hypothetical protein PRIPAC_83304 [Pristionchus pacificus]|uniref:Uncharacterized protein n=1 Tax=Pristionchus pacificus TaxID=54126 RepID=A0A2A6C4R8_PRIPA|nr:hypothetical protein PRIPAC_83304 [Pristionchus pacificus]|eukprot:PDM73165.1 hypothetical protein PRIPAC_43261 [Pristionchus pacificus]